MTAAAPASTPQVGWLTTSTAGFRRISRPTTNFCRFPPDRLAASGSRLALRTSKVSVVRSTVLSVAAPFLGDERGSELAALRDRKMARGDALDDDRAGISGEPLAGKRCE